MSSPATCDSDIFCSVIYDSCRVNEEQLKDPSAKTGRWLELNPSGSLRRMSQSAWKIHNVIQSFEENTLYEGGEGTTEMTSVKLISFFLFSFPLTGSY